MKTSSILKTTFAAIGGLLIFASCCNNSQQTMDVKAPYSKKYTNADFYDAQGNFKADVAKEAFLDMFAYYNYPFTPFLEQEAWYTDFGLGDFEHCGMGGVFYLNDSVHGYFAHDIYLLPGQMLPEHKHVATQFPAKMESWKVQHGWIYNFTELGEPTPGYDTIVPASQLISTISKNYVKQTVGEILTLKALESWHFMEAGPEGAIVNEYANYHDGAGLVFSNPEAHL